MVSYYLCLKLNQIRLLYLCLRLVFYPAHWPLLITMVCHWLPHYLLKMLINILSQATMFWWRYILKKTFDYKTSLTCDSLKNFARSLEEAPILVEKRCGLPAKLSLKGFVLNSTLFSFSLLKSWPTLVTWLLLASQRIWHQKSHILIQIHHQLPIFTLNQPIHITCWDQRQLKAYGICTMLLVTRPTKIGDGIYSK